MNNNCKILNSATKFENKDFYVEGFNSFRDNYNGFKRGDNIIYILEIDGLKLCHLGSLGHILNEEIINKLSDIDILFIPIGGHFCLDGHSAFKLASSINPKYIIPMSFKTSSEYFYLDGSTKASERVSLVNEFNNSNKVKVFLISLKAGGTGLNLTSADVVIHFDPWWNPAIEDQATDRAHRFGQKNVVEVIKLISKGSIEEKIIKLQESKKEIINEIMNGNYTNGGFLSSLDADEIKELFS